MKKLFLCLFVLTFHVLKADDYYFCGADYSHDSYFYNLFSQEIIDDPQYYPFLRTEANFYEPNDIQEIKNENIEAWQAYFDLPYEQTEYLVFVASREEIQQILKTKSTQLPELNFINTEFVNRHKQALLYLAYAKYLSPYMRIAPKTDYLSWYNERTVADLDEEEVTRVLKQSWQAETDLELKLRYGYQLVRFAHYNRAFEKAIEYFEEYVEPLNHKTIMYYYALDQKGGAEYGLGNYAKANEAFFQFFMHTKNHKKLAFKSMRFYGIEDINELLQTAKTTKEKNDVYLLIGYNEFYNPNVSIQKIIKNTPNAIQAKVLMARAINQLERSYLPVYFSCSWEHPDCMEHLENRFLPINQDEYAEKFLLETLEVSENQAMNPKVKDKDFWNITTAYLYFLRKEFIKSLAYLGKVHAEHPKYQTQKAQLEVLIEITKLEKITPEFEREVLKYYMHPSEFITDILANRYFLQGDYAQSFLLHNKMRSLQSNPDLRLVNSLIDFYQKPNKSEFEEFILQNGAVDFAGELEVDLYSYLLQLKGTVYLSQGNPEMALEQFQKIKPGFMKPKVSRYTPLVYNGYSNIPNTVFGVNHIECFSCEHTMQTEYLEDFPFIKSRMNKLELTENILKLKEIAQGNSEKAAQANFLLANFYYNTTSLGYHREIFSFQITNDNTAKFGNYGRRWDYRDNANDYSTRFYFKEYDTENYFEDVFDKISPYIERALDLAKDADLQAKILFAAAKLEQALFYRDGEEALAKEVSGLNLIFNSEAYQQKRRDFKHQFYWNNFAILKEKYSQTAYYQDIKTNCKYFDYYLSHY